MDDCEPLFVDKCSACTDVVLTIGLDHMRLVLHH